MARRYGEGTVYRRPGRPGWTVAFFVDGKRKYRSGKTRREALDAMALALREEPALPPTSTDGWLRYWTSTVKVRPKTLESYEATVRLHLAPHFGSLELTELTEEVIESYIDEKLKTHSSRTVQLHCRVLSMALKLAEARGLVAKNAMRSVTSPAPGHHEIAPLTREEATKLISAMEGERNLNLYTVALFTGLRQGELVALRWTDVDMGAKTLTVNRTASRVTEEPGVRRNLVQPPKTKTSARTIQLPTPAINALRTQQMDQEAERKAPGYRDQGLVFAGPTGRSLVGTTIGKQFQRDLERAGIAKRRFHDLRHTCASWMLGAGGNLDDVKRYLGHSSIAVTSDIYGHLDVVRQRDVATLLSKVLSNVDEEGYHIGTSFEESGAPGGIRTPDRLIRSQADQCES